MTKATVRLYKVPAIIRPDTREDWKPGSQDKPIATKEVTFQLDDLGEGKGAKPFSLDPPYGWELYPLDQVRLLSGGFVQGLGCRE